MVFIKKKKKLIKKYYAITTAITMLLQLKKQDFEKKKKTLNEALFHSENKEHNVSSTLKKIEVPQNRKHYL